jgi:urease accessory protein
LAPHVEADLAVMDRDSKRMRGDLPFVSTDLHTAEGLDRVIEWIELVMRVPHR